MVELWCNNQGSHGGNNILAEGDIRYNAAVLLLSNFCTLCGIEAANECTWLIRIESFVTTSTLEHFVQEHLILSL